MKAHPSVFAYNDVRQFLAAVAEQARAHNPRFSFGAWAKKLGLSNVATLTRVVNGDRAPGRDLCRAFVRYFRFDAAESEYFEHLALAAQVASDQRMAELVRTKIDVLAARHASAAPTLPTGCLLRLSDARLLTLWGKTALAPINARLQRFGVTAVDREQALIGINVGCYHSGGAGPYYLCYLSVLSRRINRRDEVPGMFYPLVYHSSAFAAAYWRVIWGVQNEVALIAMSNAPDLSNAPDAALGSSLALRPGSVRGESAEQARETYGISNIEKHNSRHRISMRMTGASWPFDGTLDDFRCAPDGPLAMLLGDFQPTGWQYWPRFSCDLYEPTL